MYENKNAEWAEEVPIQVSMWLATCAAENCTLNKTRDQMLS